jgi:hypothetical protein
MNNRESRDRSRYRESAYQVECGAPDFVTLRNKVPTGHIEAKDLGLPLDEVAESEQLRR